MNETHPLPTALSAAVPLHIADLKARGGPNEQDWSEAKAFQHDLVEHGDVLLYGGGKKGEAARLFNRLAHAIAVLAFVPGGCTLFGSKWTA